ncbi:MAG: helix-turn-helix domain-containing protein, partial [Candidatus Binataceae bacterium]
PSQPTGAFTSELSAESVTLLAVGYIYGGIWAPPPTGLSPVRTKASFAAPPQTGFQLFGVGKCQSGRPRIPPPLQRLIREMACDNPSWGEERIANELLLKLGLRVSPRMIGKYLPKLPTAPAGNPRGDQRW